MQFTKKLMRYKISPLIPGILLSCLFLVGLIENATASVTCNPDCEDIVCDPPSTCSPGCSHTCTPCNGSITHSTNPGEDSAACWIDVSASCSCGGSGSCRVMNIKYCKRKAGVGSVDMRFSLGPDNTCSSCARDSEGDSDEFDGFVGFLWIYAKTPSVELATPEGLKLLADTEKLDILVDAENTNVLRQVKSPSCLADIVWPLEGQTSSVPYYRIDFYRSADVGEGTNGYYQPNAGVNPYAQYYIENLTGLSNACEQLRIRGGIAGGITTNIYTHLTNGNQTGWSLNEAGGMRITEQWSVPNGSNEVIDTKIVRDSSQKVISETRKIYRVFAWGTSVVEKVEDPDGANLRTTVSYYENAAETGKYMRTSMFVYPNGSWKKYDYDGLGRRTKEIRDWLNVATNATEDEARVIINDYTPLDGNDNGSVKHFSPRTVTEKVEGIVVAKTYHVYYENEYGDEVAIEEKCADPSSAYGSTNNLREIKVYYPKSVTAASSERLKSVNYPDGHCNNYVYEYGSFNTNADPAQAYFNADTTGEYIRVTVDYNNTTNGAVAGKSTRETKVYDVAGGQLMHEKYVYTSQTNYTRVEWTVASLDYLSRPTKVDKSNGTYSEATWGCCGEEWEKDENGIEYSYTYDALTRVTQKVKSGTTGQADQYTTYTYDVEDHLLTEIISASGLSQGRTNQYDMAVRLTNNTDFAGLATTTAYSQDGLTTTETLPSGYTRITERYKDGQIKSITGTAQISQYYEYGVNEDGTKWAKIYSASNNSPVWIKTTTDLLGRTAKVEKSGYSGAETIEYTYNSKGQLAKATSTGRPDSLYAYDEIGNRIRSGLDINNNGEFDLAGTDRIAETDKSYVQISSDWYFQTVNKLYAVDNSADATTNSVTREKLTGLSGGTRSVVSVLDAYGNETITTTTVDPSNKKVTQTVDVPDSSSNVVTVAVNGLVQSQTSKSGITTSYSYDSLGRRTATTDPRTGTITIHYDSHGWLDYVEDAGSRRTSYTYDSTTGRKLSQTDPLSNITYYAYTAYGQLEKTWGSGLYPVFYDYDSYGRMTKMNTYRGGSGWSSSSWPVSPGTVDTTEWIYHEASGLLTSKKDAAGNSVSYTYSSGGKLASRTWARTSGTNSLTTSYSYSDAGDLLAIDYSDSTPDVSFTYDRLGRQKTADSEVSSHTFAYSGLLLDTETIISSVGTNVIDRSYDGYGRTTGFTMGDDYSIAYGYDGFGRFNSVSFTNASYSSSASYSYLQNSDLISTISIGDIQTTHTYEQNRTLLTQIKNEVDGSTLSQFDYANDAGGRRTSIKYSGSAFETGASFNKYEYNNRSEILSGDRYWGANLNDTSDPVAGQGFAYAYDNIGNRTGASRDSEETIYTANNLNQYSQRTAADLIDVIGSAETNTTVTVNDLATTRHQKYWHKGLGVTNDSSAVYQSVNVIGVYNPPGTNDPDIVSSVTGHVFVAKTPEQFTYDDDGNLTNDGRFSYAWDSENRLIGAETLTNLPASVPRIKVEFAYDYMSRRVSKQVSNLVSGQWTVVSSHSFIYDGWNLIRENTETPSLNYTNTYTWGLDLSGTLNGAGGVGGLLAVINGTNSYCVIYDANGNVSEYISASGTILAHYEYDAYGGIIVAAGQLADSFSHRFSTKPYDQNTDLVLYEFRVYSPNSGRFLSRDPIEDGFNLYLILRNAPVLYVDKYGLCALGATEWRSDGEGPGGTCWQNFGSVWWNVDSAPSFSWPSPDTAGPGINVYRARGGFNYERVKYKVLKERQYKCVCDPNVPAFKKQANKRKKREITNIIPTYYSTYGWLFTIDLGDLGEFGLDTQTDAFVAGLERTKSEYERIGMCPAFGVWY